MNLQKIEWEIRCNCRNSKCMKLYCECFAARVECGRYCHCVDCHNKNNAQNLKLYKEYNKSERKSFKQEVSREHKGCACRKSGCTKRYCECYQAGLLCGDHCKCIQCQNNESLSNKKVISQLKKNSSSVSNKGVSLYPIILTQDNRHLNQILSEENPLNIKDNWIEQVAQELYKKAHKGSVPTVIQKLLDILGTLQNHLNNSENQQKNQMKQEPQNGDSQNGQILYDHKLQQSEQMIGQQDAQSPLSYQNLEEKKEE